MTIHRITERDSLTIFIIIILSVILTGSEVRAQTVDHTKNGADKTLRSNARVNPSTLAMEFSLPVTGLSGRADNSLGLTLEYSSKVWSTDADSFFNGSGNQVNVEARFAQRSSGGWSSSLDVPRLSLQNTGAGYDSSADTELYKNDGKPWKESSDGSSDPGSGFYLYYIPRVRVTMPDGSTHEFRRDDRVHEHGIDDDFHLAMEDVYYGSYLSIDGTRMRLEISWVSDEMRNVLYMPDGSRWLDLPGEEATIVRDTQLIDRHGNKQSYNSTTRIWTDTMGRHLTNPVISNLLAEPSEGTVMFVAPGLASSTREYDLVWETLDTQHATLGHTSSHSCLGAYVTPIPGSPIVLFDVFITGWFTRLCGSTVAFNPVVLTEVNLPDGSGYKFKYNLHGEIEKIEYPSGGYEAFTYAAIAKLDSTASQVYDQTNRGVVERRVSATGSSGDEVVWTYEVEKETTSTQNGAYHVEIHAPDGTWTKQLLKDRHSYLSAPFGLGDPSVGRAFETKAYNSNDALIRRTLTGWVSTGPLTIGGVTGHANATRDLRPEKEITMIFEPGATSALATMSETIYDTAGNSDPAYFSSLNPKQSKTYHYVVVNAATAASANITTAAGWFSAATPATVTEMDYLYDANYKARNINGLVTETRVLNPTNTSDVLAKSQFVYDEAAYFDNNYTTTNWEDPNSISRGNVATVRTWNKDTNTWIESHTMFDNFGNVRKVWDTSGDPTRFVESEYDPVYKYAYPTKVIAPAPDPTNTHGTNQTSTGETTYDFTTGLPLSVEDDFGQVSTTEYDALLRPIRLNPVVVNGVATGPKTETVYSVPDSNGLLPPNQRFVKVRKQIDANNWDEAITWFDGLGRTIKTQAKDSQGDVFVETHYDEFGRADRVTNPYRSGDTLYWSKTRYDAAGRAVESYAPATLADVNANNLTSLGVTSFDISTVTNFVGTVVTSTDASGRKGRSITNGLGQLLRVDEPSGIGGTADNDLGTLASPHQPTYYKYDVLGKMVEVTQGVQKRWFKYDSLGRLIRVRQPEQEVNTALNLSDTFNTSGSWTAGFTYDVMGNVLTATDANGVTITNTYDQAGRVKTRTYSGEPQGQTTPLVSFYYDGKGLTQPQSPNFAKGKLTRVASSVSETQYKQFDNMGRLLESSQITDGQTYTSKYSYNLSGALIEETYPSGRKVRNEFEPDGDLARIYGKANPNAAERTYASTFSYMPDGRIEKLKLGNGLWESAKFNTRLQVTEFNLGHGPTSGGLWKLQQEYGEIDGSGNLDATKNTGNIARQTLSFDGLAQPFVTSYKYDSLYRLKEARETSGTGGSAPQTWKQAFTYDLYGNRLTHQKYSGTTQIPLDNTTHPQIDAGSNRFSDQQGYDYDKNGNLIVDPSYGGRQFVFNGDNKQKEVRDASNNLIGEYLYDGEGKRIKKKTYDGGVLNEETVFVYSAGKLIAEYSNKPPPENPTTNWTVTDQLGSPRILVNSLGEVVSRRDFMPFGEEILPDGANLRTTTLKYKADTVRQKFTGYQKDEETGLDFAEARMYENRHARFTAVDPLLASGKSANPQTFNRYVYVMNNPLAYTDPTGLQVASWAGTVFTNGRSFSPNAFIGEKNEIVEGTGLRYVDASDGYSYSYSEAGSTLLGRTDALNARAARMMPDRTTAFLQGFGQAANDATDGIATGAENFGKGILNTATDAATGGSLRNLLGYDNPLALERTPYANPRQAAYGALSEVFFTAATSAASGGAASAGAARSSTLSVVPETQTFRFSSTTSLAETPQSILMPGGNAIGSSGSSSAIRELSGGTQAAESLMSRLIGTGARPIFQPRYSGQMYELNQGGIFGFRTQMTRSPGSVCTIDCKIPNIPIEKIKF